MRVETVEKLVRRPENARAVTLEGGAGLAAKNFAAALESEDSLFALADPVSALIEAHAASGCVCSGDTVVSFKESEMEKRVRFAVLEKLVELLKAAGSQETLEAKLCLVVGAQEGAAQGGMQIRLAAKGDSAEQAVLRWGLGLAHLQQALLFTSRHVRMQWKQAGN